jgi:hypothetical protein
LQLLIKSYSWSWRKKSAIEGFINIDIQKIDKFYNYFLEEAKANGEQFIKDIERRLRSGWGWFAYMPPESRGAILATIVNTMEDTQYANNFSLTVRSI